LSGAAAGPPEIFQKEEGDRGILSPIFLDLPESNTDPFLAFPCGSQQESRHGQVRR
jgi:hypothetical protein